jgi:hypothetical protein
MPAASYQSVLAGAITGCIESAITFPFETAKTRLQLLPTATARNRWDGGMVAVMKSTVETNGIRGLYYGLPAMLLQASGKLGIRFGANEQLKRTLQPYASDSPVLVSFGAGVGAGATEVNENNHTRTLTHTLAHTLSLSLSIAPPLDTNISRPQLTSISDSPHPPTSSRHWCG